MDVEQLIGVPAVIAALPVIVAHVKGAVRAGLVFAGRLARLEEHSAWPLVTDVLAIAAAFLLWDAGQLPDAIARSTSVVLVGLAMGVLASQARDIVTSLPGRSSGA